MNVKILIDQVARYGKEWVQGSKSKLRALCARVLPSVLYIQSRSKLRLRSTGSTPAKRYHLCVYWWKQILHRWNLWWYLCRLLLFLTIIVC